MIDNDELERVGAMESKRRNAEFQAQMGNPHFRRTEIDPTTACMRCDTNLFAWDDHCPSCGMEFVDLMQIAHSLLDGCKVAISWFEAAPIDEIEAVEAALEWNAPTAELRTAIKKTGEAESDQHIYD